MHVIEILEPGGPEQLVMAQHADPEPRPGEVRIRVRAAGVNRPDVLQRQGKYAPPPGSSPIPGLEVAGEIDRLGPSVTQFSIGDRVCALVSGGGYAEYCLAPAAQCLPIPEGVSWEEAAALPETWLTVWANVFELGQLRPQEILLVHGGSSGIGHTAIQLALLRGARVFTTSSSASKVEFCQRLGAELSVNYQMDDFVTRIKEATEGRGVDVVLDMVGGDYLGRNLDVLAFKGRHVSIAFLRGMKAELPIHKVMAKQIVLTGSYLRRRAAEDKAKLVRAVKTELWPYWEEQKARPYVDKVLPLSQASEAHRVMESGEFLGKIVLRVEHVT